MIQERTIAQVVRDYRDRLTNSVYETLNGRTDAVGMRRAHRDMIFRLGPDAYTEGLREGGVPVEELDATDRKAIRDWINEQYVHVNKFADDTVAARGDDGKRGQILSRLDMWIESMRTIGNQGLMSAQKNSMGTWRLGPTELHCKTGNGRIGCANLHGKRHRLSWFLSRGLIPRQPGSAILGCKGYKCLCEIRGDDNSVLVPSAGRALRFDPNQPRDEEGKWTKTGIPIGSNRTQDEMQQEVDDIIASLPPSLRPPFKKVIVKTELLGDPVSWPQTNGGIVYLPVDKMNTRGIVEHEALHTVARNAELRKSFESIVSNPAKKSWSTSTLDYKFASQFLDEDITASLHCWLTERHGWNGPTFNDAISGGLLSDSEIESRRGFFDLWVMRK